MNEFFLAIDLGGTKVLSAVVDSSGEIRGEGKKKTHQAGSAEDVVERVLRSASAAVDKAGLTLADIAAVGVGSPGPLDPATGVIEFTPNLHFRDFPLRERIENALGRPVFLNNDVTLGTLGEWKMGAGIGVSDLVGIFVGTGIGGGLILNGALYEGANRMAGEIGHVCVDMNGPRCGCGARGCLESLASRSAIMREIQRRIEKGEKTPLKDAIRGGDPPVIKSRPMAEAYRAGDDVATTVLNKAAACLGIAISGVVNLLNPAMVVLGGGVIGALGPDYVAKIADHAAERAFKSNWRNLRVAPALLGDYAVIHGAALYARDRLAAATPT